MWDNAYFFPLPTCYKLRPKKRIEKKKKKKKKPRNYFYLFIYFVEMKIVNQGTIKAIFFNLLYPIDLQFFCIVG